MENHSTQSLGVRSFELSLTRDDMTIPDVIVRMEQLIAAIQSMVYTHLGALCAFELFVDDHVGLYLTLPHGRADLFQKYIAARFDDIQIQERGSDHHLFSGDGAISAAYATATDHEILQMKTHEEFSDDPMAILVKTLSDIHEKGGSASVQWVLGAHDEGDIQEYGQTLDRLEKGSPLSGGIVDSHTTHFFSSTTETKEATEKKLDDDAVLSINKKLGSTMMHANIRILASGSTKQKSDDILLRIESAFSVFRHTKGNGIRFVPVLGPALTELVNQYALRFFSHKQLLRVNMKELASMCHFLKRT